MNSEKAPPCRTLARPSRRLLNNEEAAEYLGYRTTALLKNLPLQPIQLTTVGVGKGPRWDVVALDRYIDELSKIDRTSAAQNDDLAQSAFELWEARDAAKRA